MAENKRISELTAASALDGTELMHVVQGGNSRQTTAVDVANLSCFNRDDVTALLADTTLTYTAGQPGTVAAGDHVQTRAEGFSYQVAASGASDHHVTTAGGVKLYVLAASGRAALAAFGIFPGAANSAAWEKAIAMSLAQGVELVAGEGTYIIDGGNDGAVYLNKGMTADGQGVVISGAGRGKTIFKEADGSTATGGRYTTMFYCWLADPDTRQYRYGSFTFRDMTFDKNGRSNTATFIADGEADYAWEGAHIIKFQGSGDPITGDITEGVDAITFERVDLIDKIGAGIVLGPAYCPVRSLVMRDIQSTDHPSIIPSGGPFGQKGCIEVAIDSDLTTYDSIQCIYSQIEPTGNYDAARKVEYKLTNSVIDSFEFTFLPGANNGQSNIFIDIANLTCKNKYISRGCRVQIANSRLKCFSENYDVSFKAVNTTFLLPYNAVTEEVSGLYFNRPVGFTFQPVAEMHGCEWLIDAETVSATCTGYGIRSNLVTSNPFKIRVFGGRFDPRLEGVCSTYSQGGDIELHGVKMAARSGGKAVTAGTYSSFVNSLRLVDCDFTDVAGDWVRVQQAAAGYNLEIVGAYSAADFAFSSNNAANILPAQFPVKPTLFASAAPTSGLFFVEQEVRNIEVDAGDVLAWRCTTAGSPGTFKAVGYMSDQQAAISDLAAAPTAADHNAVLAALRAAGIIAT